ncbi:hypothetical protein COO60DRAFT_1678671 [Scenedesmus sp. NREL 46B-D3]|nr:hypothetical protein COO60DRAFT_1678671 [Scenedesmus sp. NREL 46B-D3]
MAQLLSRRDVALLRKGLRAVSSNRKLVVTAFSKGSKHESRRTTNVLELVQPKVQLKLQVEAEELPVDQAKVQFQLPHHVEWGQDVCLVGEADELGAWDVGKCIPMAWHDGDVWTAEAQLQQGAHFEYKYVVREGEGEARGVVEWQPCMNLDLTADEGGVTVRDDWEGMLPVLPPPSSTDEAEKQPTPAAAPAAPIVLEAPPHQQQQQQQQAALADEAGGAAPRVEAAPTDVEQSLLPAGELAAPRSTSGVAAAAPAVLGSSSKAAPAAQGMGPAEEVVAAHIRQPPTGPVTPSWLSEKSPKQQQMPQAASAAAPHPARKRKAGYANPPTRDLKAMSKQRRLSIKGQRAQLLQRLQLRKT